MKKKVIIRYALLAFLTIFVTATLVPDAEGAPKRSRKKKDPNAIAEDKVPHPALPWAMWIIGSAAVYWVGFKDAKRSHLD